MKRLREELVNIIDMSLSHHRAEFNDKITRDSITRLITGYMSKDETIDDYRVICDETNNPPDTIDASEGVAEVQFTLKGDKNTTHHVARRIIPTPGGGLLNAIFGEPKCVDA